jgi:outer membrane protein assembly factor BamB
VRSMPSRWPVVAILVLAFVALLAACSGGTKQTTPTATPPASSTAATIAPESTVSPSPSAAISPWTWTGASPGDWVWVRSFSGMVIASSGPMFQGHSSPGASFFNGPGRVTALDPMTGKERWHFDTPSQPFPAAQSNANAIFGTAAGTVFALDAASGRVVWQQDFPGIPFQVITTDSAVVVADGDPEAWGPGGIADKTRLRGRIRALDPATGKQRWEANLRNFAVFVAATGNDVLAASYSFRGDDDVVLLGPDGKLKWSTAVPAVSSPPLVAGGAVVVAGSDLRKLDLASGKPLWVMPPRNGGTFVAPMLLSETIVAATNTHSLEARSFAKGSLSALAEFPDCGFLPLEDSPYALACGGLVRIDLGPQLVALAPVLVPQGRLQSVALALGHAFFASTIGDSGPPVVSHYDLAGRK